MKTRSPGIAVRRSERRSPISPRMVQPRSQPVERRASKGGLAFGLQPGLPAEMYSYWFKGPTDWNYLKDPRNRRQDEYEPMDFGMTKFVENGNYKIFPDGAGITGVSRKSPGGLGFHGYMLVLNNQGQLWKWGTDDGVPFQSPHWREIKGEEVQNYIRDIADFVDTPLYQQSPYHPARRFMTNPLQLTNGNPATPYQGRYEIW